MIPVKLQQPFCAQLAKLCGQAAPLHGQVVRQLLPGEGNVKFRTAVPAGLCGQIGQELGPGSALPQVCDFFIEIEVLAGQVGQ